MLPAGKRERAAATGKASGQSCCLLEVAITMNQPRSLLSLSKEQLEERFNGWKIRIIAKKPNQET